MKIDKASQILEEMPLNDEHIFNIDQRGAIKLGIEALKRIAFNRLNTIASSDGILPGETE